MRCDECQFWKVQSNSNGHVDDIVGKCHRFPPQLDPIYAGKREDEGGCGCEALVGCWYQPLSTGEDWCGEFKCADNK